MDVIDPFTDGSGEVDYILGQLFFQVPIAYGAVVVIVAEMLHGIGSGKQIKKIEEVGNGFCHGRIGLLWPCIGHRAHYLFPDH